MKKFLLPILAILLLHMSCDKLLDSKAEIGVTTGTGGSLARFTIAGNYLYTVDKTTLKAYDITNPASPIFTQATEVGFEIETIYPFKDKLFIGSTSVVHIFSIADPSHPEKLSTAISPEVLRRCDPVVAKDSVAYATLRSNGACGGIQSRLAVYDIRDVLHPVEVYSVPVTTPYGLGYIDSALYVCDFERLLVFNITNPFAPEQVTQVTGSAYFDVIPIGNTLVCWTHDGVAIYDITNRFSPQLVTKIV